MQFLQGIFEIAVVVLSIIAGIIGLTIFKESGKREFAAWRPLIIALVLFAVEEAIKALRSFEIYSSPFLTHVIPSFILAFLMYSLLLQIIINKYKIDISPSANEHYDESKITPVSEKLAGKSIAATEASKAKMSDEIEPDYNEANGDEPYQTIEIKGKSELTEEITEDKPESEVNSNIVLSKFIETPMNEEEDKQENAKPVEREELDKPIKSRSIKSVNKKAKPASKIIKKAKVN